MSCSTAEVAETNTIRFLLYVGATLSFILVGGIQLITINKLQQTDSDYIQKN